MYGSISYTDLYFEYALRLQWDFKVEKNSYDVQSFKRIIIFDNTFLKKFLSFGFCTRDIQIHILRENVWSEKSMCSHYWMIDY